MLSTDLASASNLITVSYNMPDGALVTPQPINILKGDLSSSTGSVLLCSSGGGATGAERQILEFHIAKIDSSATPGGSQGYNMYCALYQRGGSLFYEKRWKTAPTGPEEHERTFSKSIVVHDAAAISYRYTTSSSDFNPGEVRSCSLVMVLSIQDPASPSMAPLVFPISVESKVAIVEAGSLPAS
jgi:hypothetical protein